ncbi:hypothetical protein M3J07_003402 [Ascochyta lentis]
MSSSKAPLCMNSDIVCIIPFSWTIWKVFVTQLTSILKSAIVSLFRYPSRTSSFKKQVNEFSGVVSFGKCIVTAFQSWSACTSLIPFAMASPNMLIVPSSSACVNSYHDLEVPADS